MDFHSYDDDSQLSVVSKSDFFFPVSLRGCMSGLNPSFFCLGPSVFSIHQARSHQGTKVVIQILICNSFGFVLSKGPVPPPVRDLIHRKRHSAEMSLELFRI